MDIVVSNSNRYVSVDSITHESTDVVKLKNTENEFTGKFLIQDGTTTRGIDDVFVKGIRIGQDGRVEHPVNGIVTVKNMDDGCVKGIRIGKDGEVERPVNGIVTMPATEDDCVKGIRVG